MRSFPCGNSSQSYYNFSLDFHMGSHKKANLVTLTVSYLPAPSSLTAAVMSDISTSKISPVCEIKHWVLYLRHEDKTCQPTSQACYHRTDSLFIQVASVSLDVVHTRTSSQLNMSVFLFRDSGLYSFFATVLHIGIFLGAHFFFKLKLYF